MATQKVTEKILEDAKKEAKEILDKYKKEANKIKEEFAKRIDDKRTQIEDEVKAIKKTEMLRAISQKRLELNKKLTEQKHKFIKEIIKDALKKLAEHKKYLDFLKTLIMKSGEKQGELILSNHDKKKYASDLENFLKNEALNYTIKEDKDMNGGVILKKEKTTYLGSLDLISELLRDELAIAVSKILW